MYDLKISVDPNHYMNEERQKPDGEENLTSKHVHEENRKEERQAHDHENQNPDLGREHNPIHHGAGGR